MPVVSITLVCWICLKNPAYDTYCTGTINKEKDGQAEGTSPFHHDSKFASNSAGCTMPVNSSLLFARPWNTVFLLHSSHHIVSEHQTGGTLKAEEHWKARKSSGLCVKVSVGIHTKDTISSHNCSHKAVWKDSVHGHVNQHLLCPQLVTQVSKFSGE